MSDGVFLPTDDYHRLVAERVALRDECANAHVNGQRIEEVGQKIADVSDANLPPVPLLVSSDNPAVQLHATLQTLTSEMERIRQNEDAIQQSEEALQKAKSQQRMYIVVGIVIGLLLLGCFLLQFL